MCGIVGFIGDCDATPILLDGLSKLEYRGYDSAGIAVMDGGKIAVKKSEGKLQVLKDKIDSDEKIISHIGIGHTRWATHGRPNYANSHPHKSQSGKFAIVHNGIIENYAELKKELISQGVEFLSETDTEVVAQLLEKEYDGDLLGTVKRTVDKLVGSYALGIICNDYPEEFIAVRNASPLIVGLSENGKFIASDIPAILPYTRTIYRLNDNEIVRLTRDEVQVYTQNLEPVQKEAETITWSASAAEKGGHEHFMIKEILEQPKAIADTISPRIDENGDIVLDGITLTAEQIKNLKKISIVACGSAYHVGMVAKYVLEKLTRIPIETDLASEFRYRDPIVDENTLVIIISQSGETADTLEALRSAKKKGARILSVVNVVGSSIANESDDVLYTWAGPEISVATTKAYSTQLIIMYLIAVYMAQKLGKIDALQVRKYLDEIVTLPDKIEKLTKEIAPKMEKLGERYKSIEHAYFIGRNVDYAVALEGALKLKEISYIHAECYAAGELKHGSIALIEDGTLVVALAGCSRLFEKTRSNIVEVKARGARVLAVTQEGNSAIEDATDEVIYVPTADEIFIASLEVVPVQLFSYYTARAKGCNIDKPKNLAKSVTVE